MSSPSSFSRKNAFVPLLTPVATAALVCASASAAAEPAPAVPDAEEAQAYRVVVTGADRAGGSAPALGATAVLKGAALAARRVTTSDTAALLADMPGVAVQTAGGASGLPVVRGLADDRLHITVDGADAIASCPNHMNPPLSYLDPSSVANAKVYAGVTPVSVGGDSIGGTVVVETAAPAFAESGKTLAKGQLGAFYRSNGHGAGGNVSATFATDALSLTYRGAVARAGDYRAAGPFKNYLATGNGNDTLGKDVVGSTAYRTQNQALDLALRNGRHLWQATYSHQSVPYQLYPNQRMDMLANDQDRLNLRYRGQYDWGSLEAQAYREKVDHYMDFGEDKRYWYGAASNTVNALTGEPAGKACTAPGMPGCANGMPMYTRSRTTGAKVRAGMDLASQGELRLGAEYQHYTLNDWWPPSGGGMYPYTFLNIHDGKRERLGVFAEWEKRHSAQWITQLGVRYERVRTSAGPVHGYDQNTFPVAGGPGTGNQIVDAAALNKGLRNKTDHNADVTAMARYTMDDTREIEFGFAHKERSPNLYERYTWSTWSMAAVMNNTVGDGNGYLGNPALRKERANTVSATFDWHAPDRAWEFKATPFYTRVNGYIDAVQWSGNAAAGTPAKALAASQFNVMRYTNQNARLYGIDLSGHAPLASTRLGNWGLRGSLSYVNGKNTETGSGLYNVMPLNARLALEHQWGNWGSSLEWAGVAARHDVSVQRNEIRTPGYGLLNVRTSYGWKNVRLDLGVENLLNKHYALPLGGAYTGQGRTMGINSIPWGTPVPGPGRSFHVGVNVKF